MDNSSNRIRHARRRALLSQHELGKLIGVHRSAVAQWECAGGCRPTAANLARLAIVTMVGFEWLATGRGPVAPENSIQDGAASRLLDLETRAVEAFRRIDKTKRERAIDLLERLASEAQ